MKTGRLTVALGSALLALTSGLITLGLPAGPAAAAGPPPWEPDPGAVGGLTFYNAAGQQVTGGNLTDSPIAAYVEGSATVRSGDTVATLYGYLPKSGQQPSAWSGEQLGGSTTFPNGSAPVPLNTASLPVETGASGDQTVAGLQSDYPNTDTSSDGYAGIYQLRLYTNAAHKTQTSTYDAADIQISGSTWSVVYPAPSLTSTTTTVSTTPASPQTAGTSVQLKATVSPAAPGTVQFQVGSTNIGSPVTVSGGVATLSTTTLPVGSDTINAAFTPAQFAAYGGSSGSTSFTVSPAPAANTNAALLVNPTTAAADTAVALTATLTNAGTSAPLNAGDGTVTFYDNGATNSASITSSSVNLGSVALGSGGTAGLTDSSFGVGSHYIVASFVPSASATYNPSSSLAVLFTATQPLYAPSTQNVTAAIPAGTLTITTPYSTSNPFSLGTAVLDLSLIHI